MTSRILPGIGLNGAWTQGDTWTGGGNENWLRASVLTQLSVESATTSLPASPPNGVMYLVPAGDSPSNNIAARDNGAWVYLPPQEGWRAYVKDTGELLNFDGSAWVSVLSPLSGPSGAAEIGTQAAGAGAALRTQQAKNAEHLTPDDYRLVSDPDDSLAFARLATVINTAGRGGIELVRIYNVNTAALGSVAAFTGLEYLRISGPGKVVPAPIPAVWKAGVSASAIGVTVTISDPTHTQTVGSEVVVRGLSPSQAQGYFVVTAATPGVSFSYVSATAPGAITGTPEYTTADYFRSVIKFTDCSNVEIDVLIEGDVKPVDQMYRLGYRGVYATGTNANVNVRVRGRGMSYGCVQGGSMTRGRIEVEGDNVGYPVSVQGISGFDLFATADTVHRGVYCADPSDTDIYAAIANFDASGVLVTRTLDGDTRNVRVFNKAMPQTAALTLHRASSGTGVYVNAQNAVAANYENIRIETEMKSTLTEGIGRMPVEVDMTNVTGRMDAFNIYSTFQRKDQTNAALHTRELIFRAPTSCVVGSGQITSMCSDPDGVDSTLSGGGFVIDVKGVDGVFSIDRRGGKSRYAIAANDLTKLQWVNPYKPRAAVGGMAFPLATAAKQVSWSSARVNTGDFTIWARVSNLTDKTGARTLCIAGSSATSRTARSVWIEVENSANDILFAILGTTTGDTSGRRYTATSNSLAGYFRDGVSDIFAIRRSGALELWIDGIRLNGVVATTGTPPGEGGQVDSDFCIFNNANAVSAFSNMLSASGFFSKALSAGEMDVVSRGGLPADTSTVLHQSNYTKAWRASYQSSQSTAVATIGSDVSVLDPWTFGSGITPATAATTLSASSPRTQLADATAGAFSINLPTAASASGLPPFNIKKIDASANAVTIDPNGAETIDGATTLVLNTQWQSAQLQSNGTAWYLL
jgi:hypothetical protein